MINIKLNKSSRLFYIVGAAVVLTSLLTVSISGTMAKYVRQSNEKSVIVAKEFYFESDLLKDPEENAEIVLNSTAEEVSILLKNHADLLRYAQDDIDYTVTVETEDESYELSNETGTIATGGANSVSVTLSGLEKGKIYKITATGKAGYEETISATFRVSENDENVFKYLDASDEYFVLLTVWTENVVGVVNITIPEGLIPDSTDSAMFGFNNYDAGSGKYRSETLPDVENFELKYSSHTYRFFIDSLNGFTNESFKIEDFAVILEDGEYKEYPAKADVPQ